jgi:hypothetical protein
MRLQASESSKLRDSLDGLDALHGVDVATGVANETIAVVLSKYLAARQADRLRAADHGHGAWCICKLPWLASEIVLMVFVRRGSGCGRFLHFRSRATTIAGSCTGSPGAPVER